MTKIICPSMMCADFRKLSVEVEELDKAGSDIFHLDIMDGKYVPNFGMGLQDIQAIRSLTQKNIDVHLMIEKPDDYINLFEKMGVDIIYIHPESTQQPARTLSKIKELGMKCGIALNPGTSIDSVKELLVLCDYILLMTVNPGFAGQKFLDYVVPKLEEIITLKSIYSYQVMVDGAISDIKVKELGDMGVDGFILGTSALFHQEKTYKDIIKNLKEGL